MRRKEIFIDDFFYLSFQKVLRIFVGKKRLFFVLSLNEKVFGSILLNWVIKKENSLFMRI